MVRIRSATACLYQHEQRASEDALMGYEDGFAAVRTAYKKLMKKK